MKRANSAYNSGNHKQRAAVQHKVQKQNKKTVRGITRFFLTCMVVAAAVLVLLFSNKNVTSADVTGTEVPLTKYYKSITIQSGDTLWDIAKTYKSGDYKNTQAYVDEIMQINHLPSDRIVSGQKLVIAYFAE